MTQVAATALIVLCFGTVLADEHRAGYVLKGNEGEVVFGGARILASPELGTRDIEVIAWPAPSGFSTGLHYHVEADEYFFIISGSGSATIGDKSYEFEAGDFIFVPAGVDHRLVAAEPIHVFEFLDRPNQVAEMRAWHKKYGDAVQESLEQLNEIAVQFGTVYKTID